MALPSITAHSGCEGLPDGSLSAISAGIKLGADLVEVDVRRVEGLGLALTHDPAAPGTELVTLEEAFLAIRDSPSVGINCDLKEYGMAQDVMVLAEHCGIGLAQLAFSGSLTPQDIRLDPRIAQRARVYLNIEEALSELFLDRQRSRSLPMPSGEPWDIVHNHMITELDDWMDKLIETCLSLSICALNLPPRPPILPLLARLEQSGLRYSAWTINDEPQMRALLQRPGLSNLTTRQVALAIKVRGTVLTGK